MELNQAILEHLMQNGFSETAKCFSNECLGLKVKSSKNLEKRWQCFLDLKQQILNLEKKPKNYEFKTGGPIHAVAFHPFEPLLVTGSDTYAKFWDFETQNYAFSIKGHIKPFRCLCFHESGFLVSGSADCTLKIWENKKYLNSRTLKGHKNTVTCVKCLKNIIVSGSIDCDVKIWDFDGNMLNSITLPHCIRSIDTKDSFIAVAATDDICIISPKFEVSRIKARHKVDCVCFFLEFVLSGGRNNLIDVYCPLKKTLIMSLEGHQNWVRGLIQIDSIFVSISDDKTIRTWTKEGKCVVIEGKNFFVCVCYSSFFNLICAGTIDGNIKIISV